MKVLVPLVLLALLVFAALAITILVLCSEVKKQHTKGGVDPRR